MRPFWCLDNELVYWIREPEARKLKKEVSKYQQNLIKAAVEETNINKVSVGFSRAMF